MKDRYSWGFRVDEAVWCLHCERVFLWRDRVWDEEGCIECMYSGCDGSPLDFWHWDADFEPGKVYPIYGSEMMTATQKLQRSA